jgi:hypothetical protein
MYGEIKMVVFIVCVTEWHETEIAGVFSNLELAKKFIDDVMKKDKYSFTKEYEIEDHILVEKVE